MKIICSSLLSQEKVDHETLAYKMSLILHIYASTSKNISYIYIEREREKFSKQMEQKYMMLYQCNYDKKRLHWSLSIAHDSLHHVEIKSKGGKPLWCGGQMKWSRETIIRKQSKFALQQQIINYTKQLLVHL